MFHIFTETKAASNDRKNYFEKDTINGKQLNIYYNETKWTLNNSATVYVFLNKNN